MFQKMNKKPPRKSLCDFLGKKSNLSQSTVIQSSSLRILTECEKEQCYGFFFLKQKIITDATKLMFVGQRLKFLISLLACKHVKFASASYISSCDELNPVMGNLLTLLASAIQGCLVTFLFNSVNFITLFLSDLCPIFCNMSFIPFFHAQG